MSCHPPPRTATRRYRDEPLPSAASDDAAELDEELYGFELEEVLLRHHGYRNHSTRNPDVTPTEDQSS